MEPALLALMVALGPPLLFLVFMVVLTLVVPNLPANRRASRLVKDFPRPGTTVPFFGHLLLLLKWKDNLFWFSRNMFKALGSRYMLRALFTPTVNICDAEAAEALLSSSKNIEKGLIYNFLKPWLGEGLLTSSGALWHSRRKLLTPAFHFKILSQFSEHLERQAEALVRELSDEARVDGDAKGSGTINVMPLISRATLRSIRVTAMGEIDFESSSLGDEESYFRAIHTMGKTLVHRLIRPWLWVPLFFVLFSSHGIPFYKNIRVLHGFTETVIKARKAQLRELKGEPDGHSLGGATTTKKGKLVQPFLDVLLSAQREDLSISDRGIREEVDTFMFEGHDTTAMALCWALELLGRHPAEQEVLAEEVRAAGSDWESVSKLPYLDRVFKESLRLRPSVPFIGRYIQEDVDLKNGTVIPRNAAAHVHIYDLHRNPDYFPDPERFDPDRFLPENEQKRHPFAYIPFSAGPRNCIGKKFAQMEVKLFMAAIVRRFVLRSAMPEEPDIIADLVLRPRSGILLTLRPRDE